MSDLAVGFGLVLVIEGLLWALAPQSAVRLLEAAAGAPPERLKALGWSAAGLGLLVVWLVRG